MSDFSEKFGGCLADIFPCVSVQRILGVDWEGDCTVTLQKDDFRAVSVVVLKDKFPKYGSLAQVRDETVKLVLYRAIVLTYKSLYNGYDWLAICADLGLFDVDRVGCMDAEEVSAQWSVDLLALKRLAGESLVEDMMDSLRAKGVLKL